MYLQSEGVSKHETFQLFQINQLYRVSVWQFFWYILHGRMPWMHPNTNISTVCKHHLGVYTYISRNRPQSPRSQLNERRMALKTRRTDNGLIQIDGHGYWSCSGLTACMRDCSSRPLFSRLPSLKRRRRRSRSGLQSWEKMERCPGRWNSPRSH